MISAVIPFSRTSLNWGWIRFMARLISRLSRAISLRKRYRLGKSHQAMGALLVRRRATAAEAAISRRSSGDRNTFKLVWTRVQSTKDRLEATRTLWLVCSTCTHWVATRPAELVLASGFQRSSGRILRRSSRTVAGMDSSGESRAAKCAA